MVINKAFQQSAVASFLSLIACIISIAMIPQKKFESAPRKSICFILGEDKESQEYYTLAGEYFSKDSLEKTDQLIRHVRSVEELILFLNQNPGENPWGRIEMVVHGNVWSGLSLKIKDGGERAYPKELLRAIIKKELPILHSNLVDTNTIVNIWGCGIGTNPLLNIALKKCFTDQNGVAAKVNCSKKFVVFRRQSATGNVKLVQASYWPYFFKRGYRPSQSLITKELKEQYPEAQIDFNAALIKEDESTAYEESFHIPISWTVIYDSKDDRPSVTKQFEKIQWIKSQTGLINKIKEFEIPFDKYHWTVNKIIHTDDNGMKVPAIKAIGMSTVLCVLEEV